MTKVITENFRVENTNELFTSFKNLNPTLGANFSTLLANYGVSASLSLTDANKDAIRAFVDTQLSTLRPEGNYYIMASTVDPVTVISNTQKEKREFQRRVIFGNKVSDVDVRYMFSINDWVSGTVYDAFDDTQDISTSNTIVTVKDGQGNYFVYKCLDNNVNAASTAPPVYSDIDLTSYESITNDDGYVWKYLFKVTDAEVNIYKTSASLPLPYPAYGDLNVIAAAKESVSKIKIESAQSGQFSEFLFGAATSLVDGSDVTFVSEVFTDSSNRYKDVIVRRSSTLTLSAAEDAYKGMYLKSPSGKLYDVIGSTKESNSDLKLRIETTDSILPDSGATACQLVVKIKVSQPDLGGTECLAYGILDTIGTLNKIAFTDRGSKYKFATAEVVYPESISSPGVSNLRVIVSPKGGHGFDLVTEMAMSKLAVLTDFNGESTTIPDSNYYTKVGLVKNPTFSTTTFPASFDNRTVITFTGHNDKTTSYPAGSFVTQFISTVDVRDIKTGDNCVITGLGNTSIAGAVYPTEEMTATDWIALGWTANDSGDSSTVPILGSRFTAGSGVSTWQSSNPNKRGTVSQAIPALTGAPKEETVVAKIHESIVEGSNTKVKLVDYRGGFESKLHFGPIQIKSTLTSVNVGTDIINTNDVIDYGSYEEFSGDLLHFMDFDPIERTVTRKEKIKFIFDF